MKCKYLRIALFIAVCMLIMTQAALAEEEDLTPDNGIPVVTVVIDENAENYATIEEMNSSPNHSAECFGTVRIDVPEGFHYSDFPDADCESFPECDMEIRGRGNTTWGATKKPYKIKLSKKKSMLGFGKNKHWVLIANAYDRTLIKDRMTGWLGDAIKLEFTPRGVPVDLVMKNTDGTYNKYLGSYYLSENVRVDENRVDIHELKEGDTDPDKITGGYLVQGGLQTDDKSLNKFRTRSGWELANKGPEFDPNDGGYENDAQKNYIRKYIQDVEDALLSGELDGEGEPIYRSLMDVESAAKYWLIDQVSNNADGYTTGSTYIYKKEDTVVDGEKVPGKLYWGPLWDFDYAWQCEDLNDYEGFDIRHDWLKPMLYDIGNGGFTQEVKKQWPALKTALEELTADGGIIDQYYEETRRSQAADIVVNPPDKNEDGVSESYAYEDEISALKAWIVRRTGWLDKHIMRSHDLEDLVHKITFEADGRIVSEDFREDGEVIYSPDEAPDKAGYTFIEWVKENGESIGEEDRITKDMTLIAKYLPDEEVTHAKVLFIRDSVMHLDINNTLTSMMSIPYTVIPDNVQDKKVYWESSDEEIVSIGDGSTINVHRPGTVTITGKLKSGAVSSFTIIVTDGGVEELKDIRFAEKEVTLKKGQYKKLDVITVPENSMAVYLETYSMDPDIVSADPNGVLHALKAGSATVKVQSVVQDPETGYARELIDKCKVYVTGPNTMKVKGKTVKMKYAALKNGSKKIRRAKAVTVRKARGKVTYTLKGVSGSKYRKYFSVSKKTGNIVVKKGIRKGTYKLRINVRAAGDKAFRPKAKTVTVKIKISN